MYVFLKGLIVVLGLTLASCNPVQKCPITQVQDAQQAREHIAHFAVNLYKTVTAKDENKNQVISPLSISFALALLENGAEGKTRDEIRRAFNASGMDALKVHQAMVEYTNIDDDKAKLQVANALFKKDDLKLKDEYLQTTRDCLKAQVESVDFKNKLEESRQKINKFVSDTTNNKIPELFKQGVLKDTDLMVLANAIYFKSSWRHAFNKAATKEDTFYANGQENEKENVKFMHQIMEVRHGENNDVETLEMPYEHPDMAMYVMLPKQKDGLKQLEKRLTGQELLKLFSNVEQKKVEVKMPKFQVRASLDLKDTLKELGLETMFGHEANFDRMSETKLKVDNAVHEAYIDVNENGTEAAAATGFSMHLKSMPMPPTETARFVADHPFLYAIVHKKTGFVAFMGKVNKVEKQN